ncbi:MAG: Aminoglycoside phosphotransferase, partial [Thermoanaerobacterales bacterium 50_218]
GGTYVKMAEVVDGESIDRYFAVYEFLEGEDKYTWDNPTCTDEEYVSMAEILATFHNASRGFDPRGLERVEPKIMELLPTLPRLYKEFAKRECNTKFHKYYLKNVGEILEVIERTRIPEEALKEMPLNPIHCDFHPGNLKFKDNRAVGLFDFDWSKIDLRLFDVCLALAYSCCSWEDQLDGSLLLDKCAIFLEAYQRKLKELGGLPPLNEVEVKYFPTMMAAANLYLVNWDVTAYYEGTDLNDYEYLAYLQHNVRLMRWIEEHKKEIGEMARKACSAQKCLV